MKSLSTKEFENECKKLNFRGKCAVLLHNNKMQEIDKIILKYQNYELSNLNLLEESLSEYTSGILVNFEISPNFAVLNVEKIMCELFEYIPDDINLSITATYDETKDIEYANVTVVVSKTEDIWQRLLRKFKSKLN